MQHIILIGFKHVGKSVIGAALAERLHKPFIDLDNEIEKHYASQHHAALSCRQIMATHGEVFFRAQEEKALSHSLNRQASVIALGGGTALTQNNQKHIQPHCVILIEAESERVFKRIVKKGLPSYFSNDEEPSIQFHRLWQERNRIYKQLTQHIITNNTSVDQAVTKLYNLLEKV